MKLTKYKLGEILDVTRGASLSGEYYATEGMYIRLTCGNFDYQNNCFKENKSKDNLFYVGDFKPEFLMEEGDIITPLTEQAIGLLGSTAIIPESGKYIQSQDVAKIICNENLLDKNYAFYLISSATVKQQLSATAQQTKIRHTSPDKIKDCTVWIPELREQKRIGKLLRSLDRKIELNRAINQNLEQQAQALFKSWFVDFEPFKDAEFVDDDFGRRPYGWNVKPLEYLVEKVKSGDWGKDEQMGNYMMRTFCMRGADFPDIKEGSKGKMPIRYILEKNFKEKSLCDGNVVVEISGGSPTQSTGRIVLIDKTFIADCDNALICTNFCKSLENKESFSLFFYLLWQYLYDKKVMFIYENGSNGLKNLNINSLMERELFVITPKEIISRFNLVVSLLLSKKQANGIEISRLASLRDTLLPKLMAGNMSFDY